MDLSPFMRATLQLIIRLVLGAVLLPLVCLAALVVCGCAACFDKGPLLLRWVRRHQWPALVNRARQWLLSQREARLYARRLGHRNPPAPDPLQKGEGPALAGWRE